MCPTDNTDFHGFSTPCGVFTVGELKISLAALHAEGAEDGGEDSDDEIDDGFPVYFHEE